MTPYLSDPDVTVYQGDALETLRELPDKSVHTCCTSPPFYGLRDYGTGSWEGGDEGCDHQRQSEASRASSTLGGATDTQGGTYAYGNTCGKCGARRVDRQIGLEESPQEWCDRLVEVFREVRRVLRDDGSCWIEIGDSFGAGKQLLGQPWMLAFALQRDGWILRSEIIWARPNPMPESVTDRPTKSHSTVFLLSKQPRYFYDQEAIREDAEYGRRTWTNGVSARVAAAPGGVYSPLGATATGPDDPAAGRNARSVWTIPTEPTPFAHFATWPQALCRRMILAGTSERGVCPECGAPWVREVERMEVRASYGETQGAYSNDPGILSAASRGIGKSRQYYRSLGMEGPPPPKTLGWRPSCDHGHQPAGGMDGRQPLPPLPATALDPFGGSGTTALVARKLGRRAILIELNPDYCALTSKRLAQQSLFAEAPA